MPRPWSARCGSGAGRRLLGVEADRRVAIEREIPREGGAQAVARQERDALLAPCDAERVPSQHVDGLQAAQPVGVLLERRLQVAPLDLLDLLHVLRGWALLLQARHLGQGRLL